MPARQFLLNPILPHQFGNNRDITEPSTGPIRGAAREPRRPKNPPFCRIITLRFEFSEARGFASVRRAERWRANFARTFPGSGLYRILFTADDIWRIKELFACCKAIFRFFPFIFTNFFIASCSGKCCRRAALPLLLLRFFAISHAIIIIGIP